MCEEHAVPQSPFIVQEPARQWGFFRKLPSDILGAVIKAYRAIISPIYGDVCRFFPTCSAYGLEAITVHGVVKGSWLTLKRILRCHPWQAGGLDPVPPGHRTWPEGQEPTIIKLNHPVVPEN